MARCMFWHTQSSSPMCSGLIVLQWKSQLHLSVHPSKPSVLLLQAINIHFQSQADFHSRYNDLFIPQNNVVDQWKLPLGENWCHISWKGLMCWQTYPPRYVCWWSTILFDVLNMVSGYLLALLLILMNSYYIILVTPHIQYTLYLIQDLVSMYRSVFYMNK
jgi:hypothetical protein